MRTKVTASPEVTLTRMLEALGQELIDASDEEVMAAAKELGMDPMMRGSAAFAGLKYPSKAQLADFFFDLEAGRQLHLAAQRSTIEARPEPKRKARRAKRAVTRIQRKGPTDQ